MNTKSKIFFAVIIVALVSCMAQTAAAQTNPTTNPVAVEIADADTVYVSGSSEKVSFANVNEVKAYIKANNTDTIIVVGNGHANRWYLKANRPYWEDCSVQEVEIAVFDQQMLDNLRRAELISQARENNLRGESRDVVYQQIIAGTDTFTIPVSSQERNNVAVGALGGARLDGGKVSPVAGLEVRYNSEYFSTAVDISFFNKEYGQDATVEGKYLSSQVSIEEMINWYFGTLRKWRASAGIKGDLTLQKSRSKGFTNDHEFVDETGENVNLIQSQNYVLGGGYVFEVAYEPFNTPWRFFFRYTGSFEKGVNTQYCNSDGALVFNPKTPYELTHTLQLGVSFDINTYRK